MQFLRGIFAAGARNHRQRCNLLSSGFVRRAGCNHVFDNENIEAVIHFAGLKAVGESVSKPLEYYHNNVTGTLILCDCMRRHGVKILCSALRQRYTAAPKRCPPRRLCAARNQPLWAHQADAGRDFNRSAHVGSGLECDFVALFNPIGAHKSGRIGENPRGIPNTCCPMWRRWRWASWNALTCSAMITTRPTEPACGIISMWWIWPWAM